jgi:hypothetical protein
MRAADNCATGLTHPSRGWAQSRLNDAAYPHPSRRRTDVRPGAHPEARARDAVSTHGGVANHPRFTALSWSPDLVEAVATLLAEALVADLREFPNLAPAQPSAASTGVSPGGRAQASPCPRARRRRPTAARPALVGSPAPPGVTLMPAQAGPHCLVGRARNCASPPPPSGAEPPRVGRHGHGGGGMTDCSKSTRFRSPRRRAMIE